jgi:hypothetical protein
MMTKYLACCCALVRPFREFLSQMLMDSVKSEPKSFAFDLQSLISLKCFIFWGESNPFRDYEYV